MEGGAFHYWAPRSEFSSSIKMSVPLTLHTPTVAPGEQPLTAEAAGAVPNQARFGKTVKTHHKRVGA